MKNLMILLITGLLVVACGQKQPYVISSREYTNAGETVIMYEYVDAVGHVTYISEVNPKIKVAKSPLGKPLVLYKLDLPELYTHMSTDPSTPDIILSWISHDTVHFKFP